MKNLNKTEQLAVEMMMADGFNEYCIELSRKANKITWPTYLAKAQTLLANEEAVCVA